jgi:hypothetical protein
MLGLGNSIAGVAALDAAFDINSISSLVSWYKNKTGVTEDSGVSAWVDQSASGNDLSQSTSGLRPTYTSSTGAVGYVGTGGDYLAMDSQISLGALTAIYVLDMNISGSSDFFGIAQGGDAGNYIQLYGTTGSIYGYLQGDDDTTSDGTGATGLDPDAEDGVKFIFTITKSAASSATVKFYHNTTLSATDTDFDANVPVALDYIGYAQNPGRTHNGNIYEIAFFNAALSSDDLTSVLTDMADRNGITL